MDIAAVSMALANVNLTTQVSTAMLDKVMNSNEELAGGLMEMIDSAVFDKIWFSRLFVIFADTHIRQTNPVKCVRRIF